ncbi:hypothetical protein LINPERHAP1_LOCUS16492 [Linum perenne]
MFLERVIMLQTI